MAYVMQRKKKFVSEGVVEKVDYIVFTASVCDFCVSGL